MHKVWVLKQVQLAVVRAGCEDVGELSVVIVPRELEWSSAEVLLIRLGRPSILCPTSLLIVAGRIVSSIAADLLNPVECLGPELSIVWVPLSCLLTPVSEDRGKLSLTGFCHGLSLDV